MRDPWPSETIQSVTPTLCHLLGVSLPAVCEAPALAPVLRAHAATFGDTPIERCLVYAPDAIGEHLLGPHPDLRAGLEGVASSHVRLRSVIPPKTPVCFASMFTGAPPSVHGIRQYERPVLRCDTIFDALVRAGRRVAIVAVADSSIDTIFRERPLDYFSEPYDLEVTDRVLELLKSGRHDFILAYHQQYDDMVHATAPFSPEAIAAAEAHVAAFGELARAVDRHWGDFDRLLAFTPDHGAHVDPASGKGDHGFDTPEDMELTHFYRFGQAGS